jgi:hypothetical protein
MSADQIEAWERKNDQPINVWAVSMFSYAVKDIAMEHHSLLDSERAPINLLRIFYHEYASGGHYALIPSVDRLFRTGSNELHACTRCLATFSSKRVRAEHTQQGKCVQTADAAMLKLPKREDAVITGLGPAALCGGRSGARQPAKGGLYKGRAQSWSSEIYTVERIKPGSAPMYYLNDEFDEDLEGGFYGAELLLTKFTPASQKEALGELAPKAPEDPSAVTEVLRYKLVKPAGAYRGYIAKWQLEVQANGVKRWRPLAEFIGTQDDQGWASRNRRQFCAGRRCTQEGRVGQD